MRRTKKVPSDQSEVVDKELEHRPILMDKKVPCAPIPAWLERAICIYEFLCGTYKRKD